MNKPLGRKCRRCLGGYRIHSVGDLLAGGVEEDARHRVGGLLEDAAVGLELVAGERQERHRTGAGGSFGRLGLGPPGLDRELVVLPTLRHVGEGFEVLFGPDPELRLEKLVIGDAVAQVEADEAGERIGEVLAVGRVDFPPLGRGIALAHVRRVEVIDGRLTAVEVDEVGGFVPPSFRIVIDEESDIRVIVPHPVEAVVDGELSFPFVTYIRREEAGVPVFAEGEKVERRDGDGYVAHEEDGRPRHDLVFDVDFQLGRPEAVVGEAEVAGGEGAAGGGDGLIADFFYTPTAVKALGRLGHPLQDDAFLGLEVVGHADAEDCLLGVGELAIPFRDDEVFGGIEADAVGGERHVVVGDDGVAVEGDAVVFELVFDHPLRLVDGETYLVGREGRLRQLRPGLGRGHGRKRRLQAAAFAYLRHPCGGRAFFGRDYAFAGGGEIAEEVAHGGLVRVLDDGGAGEGRRASGAEEKAPEDRNVNVHRRLRELSSYKEKEPAPPHVAPEFIPFGKADIFAVEEDFAAGVAYIFAGRRLARRSLAFQPDVVKALDARAVPRAIGRQPRPIDKDGAAFY